jgi:hypothetical protein
VCSHDFGDQGVSPQQTKFAANPGRVAAPLLFVVGSLGEEDGAEIALRKPWIANSPWLIAERSARSSAKGRRARTRRPRHCRGCSSRWSSWSRVVVSSTVAKASRYRAAALWESWVRRYKSVIYLGSPVPSDSMDAL